MPMKSTFIVCCYIDNQNFIISNLEKVNVNKSLMVIVKKKLFAL